MLHAAETLIGRLLCVQRVYRRVQVVRTRPTRPSHFPRAAVVLISSRSLLPTSAAVSRHTSSMSVVFEST